MFQEVDKGVGVLFVRLSPDGLIRVPVVSAKNVMELLLARSRNAKLMPPFHPTFAQDRMEAQGSFVHKE